MNILSIESSCDDTGVAVVRAEGQDSPSFQVLSNILSSQTAIHEQYGGVYPMAAQREHEKNLPLALELALKEAKNPKIDSIVVTNGPGLSPCLWTGVNFAKETAQKFGVPLVPANHVEGHLLVSLFWNEGKLKLREGIFPALALIVSGGHTQLILVRGLKEYEVLGETRDDAAGECFDKTARILGLGYPGGPAISKAAEGYEGPEVDLPRPMLHSPDYDFSFSGLKTAVLYHHRKQSDDVLSSPDYVPQMAHSIQKAICEVLVAKTKRAAEEYEARSVVLGGGVGANTRLRDQMSKLAVPLLAAPPDLCGDNAVMIAIVGYLNILAGNTEGDISAHPNLQIV